MTTHRDSLMLDTSAEPYAQGSRLAGSDPSSDAEAAFYAMATILNRIGLGGDDDHAKAVGVPETFGGEAAKQIETQDELSGQPALNEERPHSRISASLLLAGFLGGALFGYALLMEGGGFGTITDNLLARRQIQSAPLRAAQAVPVLRQHGSAHSPKFLVQIGSYRSEREALAAWSAFARDHPDADAYKPDIKTVDLGNMGVWHRLRLSSFADKRAANVFCEQLKSDGAACLPGR